MTLKSRVLKNEEHLKKENWFNHQTTPQDFMGLCSAMPMLKYGLRKVPQGNRLANWERVEGVVFNLPNGVWLCKAEKTPDVDVPAWMKWTKSRQAESGGCRPIAHRVIMTFESRLCKRGRGRWKMYHVSPAVPRHLPHGSQDAHS